MSNREISRRSFLQGGLIAGVGVTMAPLGSQAFAALMEDRVTTSPQKWMNHDGKARFRNDALSKVCGNKVFARDIRAKDMPGWPQQQGHAMLLKATKADRIYAGYDLSLLGAELQPDRIVTADDLKRTASPGPKPTRRTRCCRRPGADVHRPPGGDPDLERLRALPQGQAQAAVQRPGDPLRRPGAAVPARPLRQLPLRARGRQHAVRRRRILQPEELDAVPHHPRPQTGVDRRAQPARQPDRAGLFYAQRIDEQLDSRRRTGWCSTSATRPRRSSRRRWSRTTATAGTTRPRQDPAFRGRHPVPVRSGAGMRA
jgi:hypothetical protein